MSEPGRSTARRIASIALVDLAIFTALDAFFATATYLRATQLDPNARWLDGFVQFMPTWGLLAVLSPGIFWLTKHHRMGPRRGLRPVLVHLLVGLLWLPLSSAMWTVVDFVRLSADLELLGKIVGYRAYTSLIDYQWYWLVVVAAHAYHETHDAITRAKETAALQLRNAELERRLSRAELDALKAQLHPHFLFNTHHAIAGLVRSRKPDAALELIADLSGMLRYTLETDKQTTVPLARELEFTRRFLTIQQARFNDRLEIEWDVAEECGRVPVPPLILQPLIENAVHHGVSADRAQNFVRVRGRMVGRTLELEIRNSTLEDTDDRAGFGVGLKNVHGRLRRLYGDEHTLDLELASPDEMHLSMTLPADHFGPTLVAPRASTQGDEHATHSNAAGG